MDKNKLIYFDNASTTRIDDRVFDIMSLYFKENYGNANSSHPFGKSIDTNIKKSRQSVANLINSDISEIIFTSGATESINLGIKGLALSSFNLKTHLITIKTEHKAVLDTCEYLESIGFDITYLPVKNNGSLDLKKLENAISENTLAVCVMMANNETGVLQDIKAISKIIKDKGIYLLSDATQAVGKIPINVRDLGIDMMFFSAHKFHGPKGVGALYFNKNTIIASQIEPIQHGGGHERNLRSGTLNVPGIMGFGKACEIALQEMSKTQAQAEMLRDKLENDLLSIEGVFINGNKNYRTNNISNVCIPSIDANVLISLLDNICISNGSACTSSIFEPSYVLKAMNLNDDQANSSIRFSFSKFNTIKEVDYCISQIKNLTKN